MKNPVAASKLADDMTNIEVFDFVRNECSNNKTEAAKRLGKPRSWVRRRYDWAMEDLDAEDTEMAPTSPMEREDLISPLDPQDLALTGHSDFVNMETGQLSRRWNKYNLDKQKQLERINAAFLAAFDRLPVRREISAPQFSDHRLCNLYTLTDYHLGMYAHASMNGGDEWSTSIAKDYIVRAVSKMIALAPKAKKAILNIQGDFVHNDGLWPVTPSSGHALDQDTRFEVLIDIVIEVLESLVELALQEHEEVELLIAEGNHDLSTTHVLQGMFAHLYRDNPRVVVHREKRSYYGIQWGNTGLFIHHGHRFSIKKGDTAALKFAANFGDLWGATKKRYGHFGHLHHEDVREVDGIKLWQHPTLAPNDSHGVQGGYVSERGARYITYDLVAGEVLSGRVTPEMVEL